MKILILLISLLLLGCSEPKEPMQLEEDGYYSSSAYAEMCERQPEAEVCKEEN